MSKEGAQGGNPPVAGVWQHCFHAAQAAGHLPAVNGWASPGMDAAPAQDVFESLSESAAGIVGGSKPKLLRPSSLVASRDSEGGWRPALHDAPSILMLLRSMRAEQQNVWDLTPGQFFAQELVDVEVGES